MKHAITQFLLATEERLGRLALLAFLLLSYELLATSVYSLSLPLTLFSNQTLTLAATVILSTLATILFYFAVLQEDFHHYYAKAVILIAFLVEFTLIAFTPDFGLAVLYVYFMVFSIPLMIITCLLRKSDLFKMTMPDNSIEPPLSIYEVNTLALEFWDNLD